jgi:hypothetical protein
MKACEKCRSLLVEALYDELDPKARSFLERHTTSCPACAAESRALKETLRIMDERARPEPGPDFWDGYWDRLSLRLEKDKTAGRVSSPWWRKLGRVRTLAPRWAYQAAAAVALLIIGVLIGRTVFVPRRAPLEIARQSTPTPAIQLVGSDPVLRARAYIDRSKLVLLALVNYDPASEDPYALNLPRQKQVSQELVAEAGRLKSDLNDPRQRRLRELVTDLETILLQIANLEAENDLEAVEFVKQGVENRGILLKINLSEMSGDLSEPSRQSSRNKTPSREPSV